MIHPLHQAHAGASPTAARQLGAGDLAPGNVVAERQVTLDERSFARFAELTGDAHPIHYDAVHARAKGLRAPIAHGLLITAVTALGATELSAQLGDSMIAMLGAQVRFVSPVFVGEAVTVRFTVDSVAPKKDNRSVVSFDVDVLSASGDVHARLQQQYLLLTALQAPAS